MHVLADPAQARHLVDRAFRIAKAERTVTCLVVPYDVQEPCACGGCSTASSSWTS